VKLADTYSYNVAGDALASSIHSTLAPLAVKPYRPLRLKLIFLDIVFGAESYVGRIRKQLQIHPKGTEKPTSNLPTKFLNFSLRRRYI
jgi:hypothetical protein